MTLQQLQYAVVLADSSSFSKAAKSLFISQPTLSSSILSLEKELDITIFNRSRNGVSLTPVGYEFINRARQIVNDSNQLYQQFQSKADTFVKRFCLSSARYEFVDQVFAAVASEAPDNYDLIHVEMPNSLAIQYVAKHISELGIVYLVPENYSQQRYLRDNKLLFHPLYRTDYMIIVNDRHPLCHKDAIYISDLADYPYLGYTDEDNARDIPSDDDMLYLKYNHHKSIRVMDKQELNYLIEHTDGYAMINGLMDNTLPEKHFRILPLQEKDPVIVGYLHRNDQMLSELSFQIIGMLKQKVLETAKINSSYTPCFTPEDDSSQE